MKFSIVVPVYKVESCLDRCVKSLTEQTYKDIEIILVDDGSPDACPEMCDKYAAQDARIKVIHKTNGGLSDARNAGTRAATGEYVIYVDSDDYIELDTCERFVPYLKDGVDIVMGECDCTKPGYAVTHFADMEKGKVYGGTEYMKLALKKHCFPVVVWLNVYRLEFLRENDLEFKVGIVHEDTEFSPRAYFYAKSVVLSDISFYHYIINDGSISSTKDKRRHCKDVYNTGIELGEFFSRQNDKKLKKYIENHLVSCYLSIFRAGQLYTYGKEFVHKGYAFKKSHSLRVKLKALLFAISPKLFCKL